jgi:hypothetical protein
LIVGIEAFTFQMVTLLELSRREIQIEPADDAYRASRKAPFHSSNVQAHHREPIPTGSGGYTHKARRRSTAPPLPLGNDYRLAPLPNRADPGNGAIRTGV